MSRALVNRRILQTMWLAGALVVWLFPTLVHTQAPKPRPAARHPLPDIVVSLERAAGCERVVPERIGTAQPATCSLAAALKFLDERGDPSRGDGRILVGLADNRGWASPADCEARGKQVGAKPLAANLDVAFRRSERLDLQGCGLHVTAADRKRPVITVTDIAGGLDLSGVTVTGSLDAGVSIAGVAGAVMVHELVARDNANGIRVGKARGGVSIRNTRVEGSAQDGIVLEGASDVTLSGIRVERNKGNGVLATGVRNLSIADAVISENTDAVDPDEAGLLARDTSGFLRITRSEISGSTESNAVVVNRTGTLELTLSESVVRDTRPQTGNNGLQLEAMGNSAVSLTVEGSRFDGNRGTALFVSAGDDAMVRTRVTDIAVAGSNIGMSLAAGGKGRLFFELTGTKRFGATQGSVVNVFGNGTGTVDGTIDGAILPAAAAGHTTSIRMEQGASGRVLVRKTRLTAAPQGAALLTRALTGATLSVVLDQNVVEGTSPYAAALAVEAEGGTVCADISGTTVPSGAGAAPVRLRQRRGGTMRLGGAARDGQATAADAAAYLTKRNRMAGAPQVEAETGFVLTTSGCERPRSPDAKKD